MNTLTPVEKTVLAKSGKNLSKEISAGEYRYEGTFKISCDLKKGESYMKNSTVSIPIKTALSLFIQRSGIPAEKAMGLLFKCMKDAAEGKEPKMAVTEIAEKKVKQAINDLPKTPCTGRLSVKNVSVEKVASNLETVEGPKNV